MTKYQYTPILPENQTAFPQRTNTRGNNANLSDSREVALEAIRTTREVARIYFQSARQKGAENVIKF